MNKTAIVMGATGLIGRHLVDELIASPRFSKVVALTRKPLNITSEKFENHIVDFEHLEDYSELLSADALFSCLGTTKKEVGSITAQRRVDVDYQYNAAKLGRQQGIDEYYLVSSSGANAKSVSAYLKMKGELEDKVIALDFKRCVIFRPSLLMGEREDKRPGEFFAGKVMPLLSCIPVLRKYRPIKGIEVATKMAQVASTSPKNTSNTKIEYYTLDEVFIAG